ncbi:MAG: methylated-DNA--[protein]-cysteine S-methyltransferase [Candidatus Dormibacteria bacterium]
MAADTHRYASIGSGLTQLWVAWTEHGISGTQRQTTTARFEEWYRGVWGVTPERRGELPARVEAEVRDVLAGKPVAVRYDLRSVSEFDREVLAATVTIPAGEVRSYGWVAGSIGRPQAARAVGGALGRNPVPVLIPCHRVVRGDGKIGHYSGGGPEVKRRLLEHEGALAAN